MFIGVDGIIVNQQNACGLTATVSKVSSGALEFIPVYSVKFVKQFMLDAQRGIQNFRVISTDIQGSNEEPVKDRKIYQEKEIDIKDSDDE